MDPSPFDSPPSGLPPNEPTGGVSAPPGGMVVVIQSQMMMVVSLGMLIVGLLVGFLLRPAVWPTPAAVVEITVTPGRAATSEAENPGETAATAVNTKGAPDVTLPATSTPDRAAQAEELMKILIGQTRHFKGAEDAPITLIEFSDFQ